MAISSELCVCDAYCCYVFSLNGELLVSIDIRAVTLSPITCVTWPESPSLIEWTYTTMCIITGHQNGHLQLWKLDWTTSEQPLKMTHLCTLTTHRSSITALYATDHYLFSADEKGFIMLHKPAL
jgi:hypothetical protein